jgi:vacuolar-type H+-ATPase subunit E/Vma4
MLGMRENNEEEVNNILKECGRKFDEIEENIKKKVKEQLNSS